MATKKAQQLAKRKPESKREKFVRLAERRTSTALRGIQLIANLSNRNNYEYDTADARKIIGALTKEVEELRRRFESLGGRSSQEFKL